MPIRLDIIIGPPPAAATLTATDGAATRSGAHAGSMAGHGDAFFH